MSSYIKGVVKGVRNVNQTFRVQVSDSTFTLYHPIISSCIYLKACI